MPSTSKKQHNFMAAVAHNPAFAKKAGVPQSVGQEFTKADTGRTFKQGGSMMKQGKPMMGAAMRAPARRAMAPVPAAGAAMPPAGMGMGMKHGGKTHEDHHHHMKMAHHHLKMAMKAGGETMEKGEPHSKDMGEKMLKHGGKAGKHHYAGGGHISETKMGKVSAGGKRAHGEHTIQEKGHTRAMMPKMKGNDIGTGPEVNVKKRGGRIC